MVAVFLPPTWLALAPIVVVEALIIAIFVSSSFRATFAGVAVANILSTVIGMPLLWVVLVLCQVALGVVWIPDEPLSFWSKVGVTVSSAAWLGPNVDQVPWLLPVALAVLAVPFFLLSIVTERPIVRRFARVGTGANLTRAVVIANLVSYVGLGLVIAVIQYFGWSALLWRGPFDPVIEWLVEIVARLLAALLPGQI